MMQNPTLTVSTSPHVHAKCDTATIMWMVSAALAPSALWGVYAFGVRALVVLLVSIASSMLAELLVNLKKHEHTLWDGSAFVTGLLVGMNMSPIVPLFIPIIASFFAILVVKWTFGGLGANWANPALGGRVFVFFSFTSQMSTFVLPNSLQKVLDHMSDTVSGASKLVDTLSSATPLSYLKAHITQNAGSIATLGDGSYPVTDFAKQIGTALHINPYAVDSFFGNVGGCIGEVSTILLIAGGIFLLCTKVITWHIPVSYLASTALFTWMFGGIPTGQGMFHGEIFLPLVSGGLMLGAIFMATDYVTSPITHKGQLLFGLGCGFFTFLFRTFGSMSEAVSVAILFMNILTPTIDRYITNRKFGEVVKTSKEAAK
ncbi:MAG: RnfABCDGE type electron transport complex subunit D [Sphaerochaeta sp.]|jgi:electron transport complex protein RnfD|nr:RnfABCDGE type electron transport complex subunit D [Sphaerochaeta sp.]MCI2045123.1 RnfABCDGE type electron transport complex subunit D [Sphaerochaeta sp.]MCI2076181.1 RnfABCDGE type electron transport complex subunit D [Sphaerochaeta sp.]MCI2103705.1 RnfABCDGE type electron transport complex subunit D [Sphaerochaeta sp.]